MVNVYMFQALKSTAKSIAHDAAKQATEAAKASAKQAVEEAITGPGVGTGKVIKGCTCTCPSQPPVQAGGAIGVPNLHEYADKLVNLISAHARKLYIPTKEDLINVESALNKLVANGIDLTDENVVQNLMYSTSMHEIPGYDELLMSLRQIVNRGATISQQGGGGGLIPVWSPRTPSFL